MMRRCKDLYVSVLLLCACGAAVARFHVGVRDYLGSTPRSRRKRRASSDLEPDMHVLFLSYHLEHFGHLQVVVKSCMNKCGLI